MNTKFFKYAGIAASVLLIAFGIGMVVTGSSARSTVNDNLAQEHITGTPDMTPAVIAAAVKESKLKGSPCPRARWRTSPSMTAPAPSASRATCASTRSKPPAAAPTPRWASTSPRRARRPATRHRPAPIPRPGSPFPTRARNVWVTETALGTALNTSYFASSVGLFAIIVGIALLLIGIGLLVLTVRWIREPKPAAATLPTPAAPIAPVPA